MRPYFIVGGSSPEAVVGRVMVALDLVSQRLLAVREGLPLSQAPTYPYVSNANANTWGERVPSCPHQAA